MIQKFKRFWATFWSSLKQAYNKAFKAPVETSAQKWRDVLHLNLLAICVSKLNNLINSEATFDIVSDSTQAEPLKALCKAVEDKRFEITSGMLADGDFYVFPALADNGKPINTYLTQQQVRITRTTAGEITEAYGIIDWYTDSEGNTFFLLRHHDLDDNGSLTISYSVETSNSEPANVPQWEYLKGETIRYDGANHIGFGWYHSPVESRGTSPIYGVPLNYGCKELEDKIFNDLQLIDAEFENGKSVIFTDPRNLVRKKELAGYEIAENVIPMQQRSGQTGPNIDIFNPTLRFSDHYSKLVADMALYEKQIGTSKGILTDNETTYTATATAVRRANADTIALIDKFRNAIDEGNRMTLAAWGVYLNIAPELYTYLSDWYDPFEDASEQWKRLIEAKQNGAAELSDLVRWIFPKLSEDEIAEKIERIKAAETAGADEALERILAGK